MFPHSTVPNMWFHALLYHGYFMVFHGISDAGVYLWCSSISTGHEQWHDCWPLGIDSDTEPPNCTLLVLLPTLDFWALFYFYRCSGSYVELSRFDNFKDFLGYGTLYIYIYYILYIIYTHTVPSKTRLRADNATNLRVSSPEAVEHLSRWTTAPTALRCAADVSEKWGIAGIATKS